MDKILKDKWLKALRSGKFKKGIQALRVKGNKSYSYCCLGVLCQITDPSKWIKNGVEQTSNGKPCVPYDFHGIPDSKRIPNIVLDEYGLTSESRCALIQINDSSKNFDKVIKYIEKNL